jgi:DedD protein
MTSSQDTEITLGTGKLLVLFFGLVAICAVFFALGYTLGKKSEPEVAAGTTAALPRASSNATKPGGAPPSTQAPSMTFYKSVEQKDPNPELTPAADSRTPTEPAGGAAPTPATGAADPTTPSTPGYLVQVAAVSKQDDAEALVEALKKKEYPAFVAPVAATDKLFRVQLGPFADIKDAEAMRSKLISDGYNPILKK